MKNLFSKRLGALIAESGISKRALAAKLGVSATSISDWTNGKIQPTAENVYLAALYFRVSADYLLGLEDETGAKIY